MKHLVLPLVPVALIAFGGAPASSAGEGSITYEPGQGPGNGKHIVFICGEIEYRCEESLPMICIRSRLNIAVADSLASAYSGIGDLGRARKEYERIATFPRGRQFYGDVYVKSFYCLGKIYEDEGQKDKAVENYERFLEIWQDADPDIYEIEEARRRLKTLKGKRIVPAHQFRTRRFHEQAD